MSINYITSSNNFKNSLFNNTSTTDNIIENNKQNMFNNASFINSKSKENYKSNNLSDIHIDFKATLSIFLLIISLILSNFINDSFKLILVYTMILGNVIILHNYLKYFAKTLISITFMLIKDTLKMFLFKVIDLIYNSSYNNLSFKNKANKYKYTLNNDTISKEVVASLYDNIQTEDIYNTNKSNNESNLKSYYQSNINNSLNNFNLFKTNVDNTNDTYNYNNNYNNNEKFNKHQSYSNSSIFNDKINLSNNNNNYNNKIISKIKEISSSNNIYTKDIISIKNELINFNSKEFRNVLFKLNLDVNDLNYSRKKLSQYINEKMIPRLLNHHYNNYKNINSIAKAYNINFVNNIFEVQDVNEEIFKVSLNFKINNLGNIRLNNFGSVDDSNIAKQLNNVNSTFNNKNNLNDKNNKEIKIHWSDNHLISILINSIKLKLISIKNESYNHNYHNQIVNNNDNSNNNNNNINNYRNNFNLHSKNSFDNNMYYNSLLIESDSSDLMYKSKEVLDTLVNFKEELEKRIEINNSIYPNITHNIQSHEEYLIIMDYILHRIEEFSKSNLSCYSSLSGGNYIITNNNGNIIENIQWNSFFPTDSSLMTEIIIKNIMHSLIKSSSLYKTYLISYPMKPILKDYITNSSKTNTFINIEDVILYKINSSKYETHFDIVINGKLIVVPCGYENMFYSLVLFLCALKRKIPVERYNLKSFYDYIFN